MLYVVHMMKLALSNSTNSLCQDTMSIIKAKKVCHSNLSVSNKKRKYDVSLLRVVEEHELDLVRSILGSTFGVGLTHSAPSMAAIKEEQKKTGKDISIVDLQNHQTVRIVTCREDDIDEDPTKDKVLAIVEDLTDADSEPFDKTGHPQKRWISFPGCDFFFEESNITNFHVVLRFKKLKGNASTVAKAMNGGVEVRVPLAPIVNVIPNAEFRYGPGKGVIYSVKSVENETAKCKLTFDDSDDSDCELLMLPVHEVTELVTGLQHH
jgi:hypothetical protein